MLQLYSRPFSALGFMVPKPLGRDEADGQDL